MATRRRSRALALAVWAAVVLAAQPTDARPGRGPIRLATTHFAVAKRAQEAGNYDQAIAEYRKAYDLAALPSLLFNLGQVLRLKGDRREALEQYQRYLAAAPRGRGATEARQYIAALTQELALVEQAEARAAEAARAADAEALAAAARGRAEDEEALRRIARAVASAAAARERATPTPTPTPTPPVPAVVMVPRHAGKALRVVGAMTVVAGLGGAGVGVYYALQARARSNDLRALGPGDRWRPELVTEGQTARTRAIVLLGAGGAAVVGGGVLYLLGRHAYYESVPSRTSRVSVRPDLSPSHAGLLVRGQF